MIAALCLAALAAHQDHEVTPRFIPRDVKAAIVPGRRSR